MVWTEATPSLLTMESLKVREMSNSHSTLGWDLGGALSAPEREREGAARRACPRVNGEWMEASNYFSMKLCLT